MPSTTRNASIKHLLTTVLEMTESDRPYQLVYEHHACRSPVDLAKLTVADLEEMFVYTPDGTTTPQTNKLPRGEINLLIDLQGFIGSHVRDITHVWTANTADDFELYRSSRVVIGNATPATAAPATNGTSKMKRHYSDYKEIHKRHFFPSWSKELLITAKVHNCCNPLDTGYNPVTAEEKETFEYDQAFMMGVLMQKVKYSSGQTIVN